MNIRLRLPRLRAVVDVLFPDQVAADDRFIAPPPDRIDEAERRRQLSALSESSPLRLVVNR